MPRSDPEQTRRRILETAQREIHEKGFAATSVEEIIGQVGIAKGGFYHHFKSKLDLGYAVVDEILTERIESFERALAEIGDPVEGLQEWIRNPKERGLLFGCPVNNLVLEVSATDPGFQGRLEELFARWREVIAQALKRGQDQRRVRLDVDVRPVSAFILAAHEGLVAFSKASQDPSFYTRNSAPLLAYLESLRS